MYLKNDKITVTIKDVVMRSSRNLMKNQLVLDPTAIQGWSDGVAARRDATQRPVSNGDFSEKATMSARSITLSGTAIAESPIELQNLRDKLVGALADGYYTEMEVVTGAGARYAMVGLEGTPSWTQQLDTVATWRLELYAPDPTIYGPIQQMTVGQSSSFGGGQKYILTYPLVFGSAFTETVRATVSNGGNVKSYPTFIVTGDYPEGFIIYDSMGHEVVYNGQVSMSAPVEIDMARGTAVQGRVDKTILVSTRQWFSVYPGEVIRPSFKPITTGTGWCDILYRDTWI